MDSNRMIGERIGKLITEKGITQQVLSDRIGVKRETVVQWLNGSRKIKAEHIIMLCKALDVSADYLLGLSEVESLDPDLRSCCDYTGLSEDEVDYLYRCKNNGDSFLYTLLGMLICDEGAEIGVSLSQAGHCAIVSDIYDDSDIAPFIYSLRAQGHAAAPVTADLPKIPDGSMLLSASDASEFYKEKAVKMFSGLTDRFISRCSKARSETDSTV